MFDAPAYKESSYYLLRDWARDVHDAIQVVPDFPKKDILFRNVLPAMGDPYTRKRIIECMSDPYTIYGWGVDRGVKVMGLESRGFIFASAMAERMGVGLEVARKAEPDGQGGWRCKLPGELDIEVYDLEYGQAALAIPKGTFRPGDKVVIADDLLATGGTADAGARLVRRQGAEVISFDFVVELADLGGRARLAPSLVGKWLGRYDVVATESSPTGGLHALLTY